MLRLFFNKREKSVDYCIHFYISRNMEKTETILALSALAHDTRLDIFRLLVETGPKGVCVGYIGTELKIPPATLNHHLAHLKQSGLVKCVRSGRQLIHSADYSKMDEMLDYLTQNCCQGRDCTPQKRKKT